jgi:carbon storage regulator
MSRRIAGCQPRGNRLSRSRRFNQSVKKAMLVLSRKVGERISIGDQVTVTIVKITGNAVRIGIEAPIDTPVAREELRSGLGDANQQAPPRSHGSAS